MNIQQFLADAARQGVFLSLQNGCELAFELSVETFDPQLKEQIIAHKGEIIAYFQHLEAGDLSVAAQTKVKIKPRANPQDPCPLSFAQQRLWFITELDSTASQYNLPSAFDIKGQFEIDKAKQALNAIVARHQVIGSTLFVPEGQLEPVQQYQKDARLVINEVDLSDTPKAQQNQVVEDFIAKDSLQPFNLATDLMLRVSALKLTASHWVMVFNIHHIASDGWSQAILFKEFCQLYTHLHYSALPEYVQTSPLAALDIQYADYAMWQKEQFKDEVMTAHLDFWTEQLADLPSLHSLVLDKPRPTQKQFLAGVVKRKLAPKHTIALNQLASAHETTLFVIIHAAVVILMSAHQNSDDIVIGTPTANRENPQLAPLIGFFANTLVLRSKVNAGTLAEHISACKGVNLAALQYQDLPFEAIVDALEVERSQAYSPLFQILLAFEQDYQLADHDSSANAIEGLTFSPRAGAVATTKFDLELLVRVGNNQDIELDWVYDKALFDGEHIEQMADDMQRLLAGFAGANSDKPIAQIDFCSRAFIDELASQQSQTVAVDWFDLRVSQRFECIAKLRPHARALHFDGIDISYAELEAQANQLARLLKEQYFNQDMALEHYSVGICLERSPYMVIGILAVLKAGFGYVPVDPTLPVDRIEYIINDSQALALISVSDIQQRLNLAVNVDKLLLLDQAETKQQLANYSTQPLLLEHDSASLAYIIYTSGSTGQPKGVMVSHKALINRIDWMQNQYGLRADDVVLQKTPFGFDVSVWEFIWTLSYGACLVIAKPEGHKDPEYLHQLIAQQQVSVLHFVPSMLSAYLFLVDEPFAPSLRYLFCSGEALELHTVETLAKHSPHVCCVNLYGPTEAAIDVSHFTVLAGSSDLSAQSLASLNSVPIGKSIQNTQLYVLGGQQQLLPKGVVGELYIGGDNLAIGYINKPDISAKAFSMVNLPKPLKPQRLYKTGDLVRIGADGNIIYLGRSDSQIKIRGFRVELSEIEYQLSQLSSVDEAKVIVDNSKEGGSSLHAFVLASNTPQHSSEDDIEFNCQVFARSSWLAPLSAALPNYMVPQSCYQLSHWPQSHNGKIDVKKLIAMHRAMGPEHQEHQALHSTNAHIAIEGEYQRIVAKAWAMALNKPEYSQDMGLESISAGAKFFALGGNSLQIIRYKGLLRQQGFELSMASLYQNPTLAELATTLELQKAQDRENPKTLIAAPKTQVASVWRSDSQLSVDMFPLANLTEQLLETIIAQVAGGAASIADIYPLSGLQQGLMFHSLHSPQSDPYVLKTLFSLKDQGWAERFVAALNQMIVRHDALRTQIVYQNLEQPYQVVHRKAQLSVEHFEVTGEVASAQQLHQYLADYRQDSFVEPDSIIEGAAPLLRLHILRFSNLNLADSQLQQYQGMYFAALFNHHVIEDNFSSQVLQRDIAVYLSGGVAALEHISVAQYRSFIWQGMQADSNLAEQFFTEQLAGFDQVALPFGINAQELVQDTSVDNMQTRFLTMSEASSDSLAKLAQSLNIGVAAIVHLAWAVVISRISNQQDVVYGTVLSGRMQDIDGIENMVGLCINTLPVRFDLTTSTIKQALIETQLKLVQTLAFEQTPLSQVLQYSELPATSGLFNNILNCRLENQGISKQDYDIGGIELMFGVEHTNYAISASVDFFNQASSLGVTEQGHSKSNGEENSAGIAITIESIAAIDAQQVAQYFANVLNQLASVDIQSNIGTMALSALDVLTDEDKQQLLGLSANSSASTVDDEGLTERSFDSLFSHQAKRTPDALALKFAQPVSYESDPQQPSLQQADSQKTLALTQSLTYAQLELRSDVFACQLLQRGAGVGVAVAMHLHRSIDWLVAVLAIFKSGSIYVPLDATLPKARLEYIVADAGVELLLGHSDLDHPLGELINSDRINSDQKVINLDLVDFSNANFDSQKIKATIEQYQQQSPIKRSIDDSAYIIYTSGSTGQPKGVEVSHRALVAQIMAESKWLSLTPADEALLFTSVSFDAFAELAYGSLLSGATLHIPNEGMWQSADFYHYANANQLTIADIPPAYLLTLLEADIRVDDSVDGGQKTISKFWQNSTLTRVIVGGEALPEQVIAHWRQLGLFARMRLINAYGPTEAVLAPFLHDVEPQGDYRSIGRPFAGRGAYILDQDKRLLPFGVPGELYISGELLAKGYLNSPTLTEQRFLPDPFINPVTVLADNQQQRMYKTADRVKWLDNQQIGFMGRIDYQIKIRGFRIELGEIEQQLNNLELVQSCQVLPLDVGRGVELVAFVLVDKSDVQIKQFNITVPTAQSDALAMTLNQPLAKHLGKGLVHSLPHYMIPSHFLLLERWPINQNGKIDRKRLAEVELIAKLTQATQNYIAPVGQTAVALAQVWANLLHIEAETISADDDFFELGGHSLLAVRLVAAIRQHFVLEQFALGIKDIFTFPILQSMADEIELMMAQQKNEAAKLALVQADSVEEGEI